ncbi:beta-N-acetylhexosaminidase [Marinilabilia salmonicolor]|uniref:beta-N-acetylhexosaminidase n=1 Tax=Marinilabilia salmonicolor TaxID=989 RepID=A0A368VBD4_9BACT|nr:family 20 glycosylhydrolase [Marinilabilia salmonicolor]RCW37630.1 hexosaminidase [Marinilabilia salmonicolor]
MCQRFNSKKIITGLFIAFFALLSQNQTAQINVVPVPREVTMHPGVFRFDGNTRWVTENMTQEKLLADYLEYFRVSANIGYRPESGRENMKNAVVFRTNNGLPDEGCLLDVKNNVVRLEASSTSGFQYGMNTLMQLLPPEIYSSKWEKDIEWEVPAVTIKDYPRFSYRGFMLDVARKFMPKEHVLKIIDYLSLHKINYLHLHLVDDNGWRLEIKEYPELTDVGAWRADRYNYFSARQNPVDGEPTPVGGYYSQKDIRDIVAYAANKQIEVIPEIEMPAHTVSSLSAFPHLTCPVVEGPINVLPGIGGDLSSVIYCAGNDSVFSFLEDVIDEVTQLFPSEYIHIGGDEAWKDNWEKCPLCQNRIKEEGLEDEEALQAWFVNRIGDYIRSKGKKVMGWDELTNGKIPEGATILGWRGDGRHALKAADQGFPFIMSPAIPFYFIRYQGPQWFEPFTYFGNNTLRDVYNYEPSDDMNSGQFNLLKGVQACLWSEFIDDPEEAEYMIFPRLAAFSEVAWSNPENRNWDQFLPRLDHLTEIYDHLGVNYASKSMFNLFHSVRPLDGNLEIDLSCIRPDVDVRYTTDGDEPDASSTIYDAPFEVEDGEIVRAASFVGAERKGEILTLNLRYNKATGASVMSEEHNAGVLTNGLLGSEKLTDGEYVDLYNRGGEFVIDLGKKKSFSKVTFSFLNNYGRAVHLPSEIQVSVSENGRKYRLVVDRKLSEHERLSEGIKHEMVGFNLDQVNAQYVKILLKATGIMPEGHVLENDPGRIGFDEVRVE